ncbi:CopD family copper resistance protein [Stutzerimonas stutzeri]|uniref:CopD family copper resistance protein n=1 Tax=Stutzerimonas stutzeri TaxID=316 RepID=UPI000300E991|nr:membrane protein [Stutzerimonas stutzeri]
MSYSLLHVIHLLAAIFFIGTLFVEVAVLSRVRQQIEPELMQRVDKAVGARLRVVLHWVVLFVYGAGIGLAWYHRQALADPFASSFATLLSLKILLAVGVFFTFGMVAMLLRSGRMTPTRYRRIHWAIFAQMVGIVLLAKGMFYLRW